MSLRINHNIMSLTAQRNLGKTDSLMSKSLERLSSGMRINRAADNPAGLVVSEQMRAQIAGLNQAIENSERGVTFAQVADGALVEVNGILNHMRTLALDSANEAVNDAAALTANQNEITSAIAAIDRIGANTKYGTKTMFSGSSYTFQIGGNAGQTAAITLSSISSAALATGSLAGITVGDTTAATAALSVIDYAITEVAALRGTIGSFQSNTLETNISNLRVSMENLTAAESTIRDADFANEMANFTRAQILMQAGTSMLAYANQGPSAVLSLL